jgi:putative membrane protein
MPTRTPSTAQRVCFVHALLVIFFSLNGPLHDLSDYYLFSAHMVQHLLLTLIMPPLLLFSTPGWMLRAAAAPPAPWSSRALADTPASSRSRCSTSRVAVWHVPALYNAAVAVHAVHIVQHLMFMRRPC